MPQELMQGNNAEVIGDTASTAAAEPSSAPAAQMDPTAIVAKAQAAAAVPAAAVPSSAQLNQAGRRMLQW